jgi:ElaB/YqjD/DUF883 family membrane-anchored ribosome-binding protein
MEAVQDVTEQNTDELRQEIDCTRAALADKVEALEDKVMGTVQSAQETVDDSIQMAKDTVATVKRTFDIKYQVEQHPWLMVGGCVLAGVAAGSLFSSVRRRSRQASDQLVGNGTSFIQPVGLDAKGPMGGAVSHALPAEQRGHDSLFGPGPLPQPQAVMPSRHGFFDLFHEEIAKVKGMAIGYVMGQVRDSIRVSMPQWASHVDSLMNGITTKLGGEPAPTTTT